MVYYLPKSHVIQGLQTLATIIPRKRKDGTTAYRAQIVIKRKGEVVHQESETFNKKRDAQQWAKEREAKLGTRGGLEDAILKKGAKTIAQAIDLYIEKVKPFQKWGRTKQTTLEAWKRRPESNDLVTDVNANWIVNFATMRSQQERAKPATINVDLSALRSMYSVGKTVLNLPISSAPFDEARPTLRKLGLVKKSEERERRAEVDEITAIVKLSYEARDTAYTRQRNYAQHAKVFVFQMFSGRRISETCRIEWPDLDYEKQGVIVRDMKDPGQKEGNDVFVHIPDQAWAIIESMPKVEGEPRIFPYNPKSISTYFQKVRAKTGFEFEDKEDNLTLHDLRHECLSWLAEKNGLEGENWDIPRLQLVSGHKDWNVLQRYVNLQTSEPIDRWKDWEWATKVLN